MIEGFVETRPDTSVMTRSVVDVKEQFGDSKISLAMGMENGSPVEGNLDNLKYFYDRGIHADILDIVANIDHIVKLAGIDYVGLGSDFDSVGGKLPNGLKNVY